jgi:hypothetical protein
MREGSLVSDGSMEEIIKNFDFSIIRIGIDWIRWVEGKALADVDFARDEEQMRIRIKNIHCPISSMFRCIKYVQRGYKLRTEEMIKIFSDWEGRSEEYREKIKTFFKEFKKGELTLEKVNTMYRMMRID